MLTHYPPDASDRGRSRVLRWVVVAVALAYLAAWGAVVYPRRPAIVPVPDYVDVVNPFGPANHF